MKPKITNHDQDLFFQPRLSRLLNPENPLFILSRQIDWNSLENEFEGLFIETKGAPAKPVKLVVGLLMLQHMFGYSDEGVVEEWVENPYWQFFCGYDFLQWKPPIHPSSLVKWRRRLKPEGLEKILSITVQTALRVGMIKPSALKDVIADTTVMPKNISFPTDSKLYFQGIKILVRLAKNWNIPLRQTYCFLSKRALRRAQKYAHARQMKKAKRECKRLKTYLRRVFRNIKRQIIEKDFLEKIFAPYLEIIEKVLNQTKESKNKVYSIHEPHTKCIAKGKAHKKYEFGCKASIVMAHKKGIILSAKALDGNPYDGHTLKHVLENAESASGIEIEKVFVDRGYRGHLVSGKKVYISGQRRLSRWFKGLLKRRQAIEPHIGHMKSEGKLGINYLKGILGDKLNTILCGIGYNLRLIWRFICGRLALA